MTADVYLVPGYALAKSTVGNTLVNTKGVYNGKDWHFMPGTEVGFKATDGQVTTTVNNTNSAPDKEEILTTDTYTIPEMGKNQSGVTIAIKEAVATFQLKSAKTISADATTLAALVGSATGSRRARRPIPRCSP